jgi:hypothetical protein
MSDITLLVGEQCGLSRARADELIRIAAGITTFAEVGADTTVSMPACAPGNVVGTAILGEVKHARQFLSKRRRKRQAARATITCGRSEVGDIGLPNKTEGHGAASVAPVAQGVRLRNEKYPTS